MALILKSNKSEKFSKFLINMCINYKYYKIFRICEFNLYRYLPATQNLNPFLQQSAVLNPQAAFGYPPAGQLRPQFQTAEIFDPNHMPWPNRYNKSYMNGDKSILQKTRAYVTKHG